ncbi:MAG TPA: hypothetical protein VE569_10385 [Acidimicrobiia bacterium]|jgi:hypothetical protein|nr:hypothetical protein [Acidimicrobiia bacterium]
MKSAVLSLLLALSVVTVRELPPERPGEIHCVLVVLDQKADGELVLSPPTCFTDERSAEMWAAEGAGGLVLTDNGALTATATSSTFTLGRHYDGFSGSGSSIRIVGGNCTGGWWNTSSWWDNRISSSYNGCARLTHWDYPNKLGISESTYGSGTINNLSYMNNKTESVSYHSG